MKFMFVAILTLSSSASFAQTMNVASLSALMTEKKAILEKINVGMSKKQITNASFKTASGLSCPYTQTAIQTVLKLEGTKAIVLSQEQFSPVTSAGCLEAKMEAFSTKVLFYENKPSLQQDLADLQASNTTSITRSGDLITMIVNGVTTNSDGTTASEAVTVKYDLSKSSFKNLISTDSKEIKMVTQDMADVDVNSMNLKNVVFCPTSSSEEAECVAGDFSDILF